MLQVYIDIVYIIVYKYMLCFAREYMWTII